MPRRHDEPPPSHTHSTVACYTKYTKCGYGP